MTPVTKDFFDNTSKEKQHQTSVGQLRMGPNSQPLITTLLQAQRYSELRRSISSSPQVFRDNSVITPSVIMPEQRLRYYPGHQKRVSICFQSQEAEAK